MLLLMHSYQGDFKMNVKGFKVNFLGDSITEGVVVSDIPNYRYNGYSESK